MSRHQLITFILSLGLFFNCTHVFASTVSDPYKYAWSNNIGYINFENTIVSSGSLSGYAWSANSGWINLSPENGGVLNDGLGNLSGYAWGEDLGWIDFGGVRIDQSTGKFSGIATGTIIGTLTFDCPNYCDVRTDWRPPCTSWTYSEWGTCSDGQQTRIVLSSLPAGCLGGSPILSQSCNEIKAGGFLSPVVISIVAPHVEVVNQNLTILPQQSGKITQDTDAGKVILEIPNNDVSSRITFSIILEPLVEINSGLVLSETQLINEVFYNVIATDQNGNYVHFFTSPITITLPVPENLTDDEDLKVYWLNETNNKWVLIPDAVFIGNRVIFQVNHLTKFAIFNFEEKLAELIKKPEVKPSLDLPAGIKYSTSTLKLSENRDIIVRKRSETIIEKITNFFGPVISNIFKTNNGAASSSGQQGSKISTTTPIKVPKNMDILWFLIIILILLIGFVCKKR